MEFWCSPLRPHRRLGAWNTYRTKGQVFYCHFGESMFHEATDASKVALHALVMRLRERGYTLLDTQWSTPHLAQFGTQEIPLKSYRRLLARALREDRRFGD